MQKKLRQWRISPETNDSKKYIYSVQQTVNKTQTVYGNKVAQYGKNDTFKEIMRELIRSPIPQAYSLVKHLVQQLSLAGRIEERVSLVRMFAEQVIIDNPYLDESIRLKLRYLQFDDQVENYVTDVDSLTAEFACTTLERTSGGSKLPFCIIAQIYNKNKSKEQHILSKKVNVYTKLDWMKDNFVFFNNAQRESYGALFNSKKQLMLLAHKRISDKVKHLINVIQLYKEIYNAEQSRILTLQRKLSHVISLEQKYIDLYQQYTIVSSHIRLKKLGYRNSSAKAQELLQNLGQIIQRTTLLKKRLQQLQYLQGFIQAFRSKREVHISLLQTLSVLYKQRDHAQQIRIATLQAQYQ